MKVRDVILCWVVAAACFAEAPSGTDGGSPSTTSASTGESPTDSSTQSGPTATSVADESTSGATASGNDSSSSSGDGSSSGGVPGGPYPACAQQGDPACEGAADLCLWTDGVADGTSPAGWCSQPCNEVGECSPPPDGDAMVACTYYGTDLPLRCMLRCENGETCPTGMTCLEYMTVPEVDGYYVFVCAWMAE